MLFPNLTLTQSRLIGAILSFILWIISVLVGDIINRDGILYLETADIFWNTGLSAALHSYNWPFYSILIAFLHHGLGFEAELSAYAINGICLVILVDAFIRVYKEAFPNTRLIWLPVITILTMAELTKRTEIVRDWGYWCFSILALLYLLRFLRIPSMGTALGWQVAILIALLFRVEAVAFIIIAPVMAFWSNGNHIQRISRCFQLNLLFIIGGGIVLGVGVLVGNQVLYKLQDVMIYADLVRGWHVFQGHVDHFAESVLFEEYARSDALPVMVVAVMVAVILWVLRSIGLFYSVVLIYGISRFGLPRGFTVRSTGTFLVVAVLVLLLFYSQKMFLVTRYATLAGILLLLFVCHYVERILLDSKDEIGHWMKRLTFTILAIMFFDGVLVTPDHKAYLRKAGLWMREKVPENVDILTNDNRLLYYSGRKSIDFSERLKVTPQNIESHLATAQGYLALRVQDRNQEFKVPPSNTKLLKVAEFSGSRGERAVIYKIER